MNERIVIYLTSLFLTIACISCDNNEKECSIFAYSLYLDSALPFFGDQTRAKNGKWSDGDVIYISFLDGDTRTIECKATYSSVFSVWTMDNMDARLNHNEGNCKIYHFRGGSMSSETAGPNSLILDEHTAIFADGSATYMVIENDIYVTAHLLPQTWRIAFKGEAGQKLKVLATSNIECYHSFSPTEGLQEKTAEDYQLTILSDGYTDYIYGSLASSPSTLTVIMDNKIYCRLVDNTLLSIGQSGYFILPTDSNFNGWDYGGLSSTEISLEGFSTEKDLDYMTGGLTGQTGSQDINIEGNPEDTNLDGTTGGPTESTGTQDITIEGYGSDKNLD